MIESLKKAFKENLVTIILFLAYSIVLNNTSRLHLDRVPGGESIALSAIFLLFVILIVMSSYIINTIFDKCVNVTLLPEDVTFLPEDQIKECLNKNKLIIPLKRYDPENATRNFSIKINPNEKKLNLTRKLLGCFNRDCAFNNIYLQVYWEPQEALMIVQNTIDDVDSYLTLKKDGKGYPCVSLKDISVANELKYSMKVSSTNRKPQMKSIRLEIRRICSIEPGNTECKKYAMKSPCNINLILGCKRYYKFINFDLKFAQATVNIDRD